VEDVPQFTGAAQISISDLATVSDAVIIVRFDGLVTITVGDDVLATESLGLVSNMLVNVADSATVTERIEVYLPIPTPAGVVGSMPLLGVG
jgi:hypothetical protein